jgi:PAS domain-containing protein
MESSSSNIATFSGEGNRHGASGYRSPMLRLVVRVLSYAAPIIGVAAVAMLLHKFPWLFERGAFAMMLGCVFLCAWFGGWRSGVLATILSAALAAYLMYPPDTLYIDRLQDWIRLGIFLGVASTIGFLAASRDRAVEAAHVSNARLQAALVAARMGAWEKHLETGAFWWSPGLEDLFGRRPGRFVADYDEFIGYIHPDDRGFVANAFTRSLEHGIEFEIAHRIVRPDLSIRWIITRGQIVHGTNGKPERMIGIAVDVTERFTHTDPATQPPTGAEPTTPVRARL